MLFNVNNPNFNVNNQSSLLWICSILYYLFRFFLSQIFWDIFLYAARRRIIQWTQSVEKAYRQYPIILALFILTYLHHTYQRGTMTDDCKYSKIKSTAQEAPLGSVDDQRKQPSSSTRWVSVWYCRVRVYEWI